VWVHQEFGWLKTKTNPGAQTGATNNHHQVWATFSPLCGPIEQRPSFCLCQAESSPILLTSALFPNQPLPLVPPTSCFSKRSPRELQVRCRLEAVRPREKVKSLELSADHGATCCFGNLPAHGREGGSARGRTLLTSFFAHGAGSPPLLSPQLCHLLLNHPEPSLANGTWGQSEESRADRRNFHRNHGNSTFDQEKEPPPLTTPLAGALSDPFGRIATIPRRLVFLFCPWGTRAPPAVQAAAFVGGVSFLHLSLLSQQAEPPTWLGVEPRPSLYPLGAGHTRFFPSQPSPDFSGRCLKS